MYKDWYAIKRNQPTSVSFDRVVRKWLVNIGHISHWTKIKAIFLSCPYIFALKTFFIIHSKAKEPKEK